MTIVLVLASGLNVRADFFVDFFGKPPLPFTSKRDNEFLWDDPEPGLATTRTNGDGLPGRAETSLDIESDPSPIPDTWDPSVPGSYEVSCKVVDHSSGLGAGGLGLFYAERDWSWAMTWSDFFVSLDVRFRQIGSPDTVDDFIFLMDTTDDFHCYRVDWDPRIPSATLFVDGEDTGLTLGADLLGRASGRTELVLGDAFAGTNGGEVIYDFFSFESRIGAVFEVCDDGLDNDGDGDIDCADLDCEGEPTCVGPFIRGDCDGSGMVGGTPTDAIVGLNYTFRGGPTPPCLAACDAEANGELGVTDYVRILRFSFAGGDPPDGPFPDCGATDLPGDVALGCETPLCP